MSTMMDDVMLLIQDRYQPTASINYHTDRRALVFFKSLWDTAEARYMHVLERAVEL